MSILNKIYNNQQLYIASLVILFFVSFAIPLLFAFTLSGLLSGFLPISEPEASPNLTLQTEKEVPEKDDFFPDAVQINAPNHYLSIPDSKKLEPKDSSDFLISLWVKPKKLPVAGESVVVFSKYDDKSSSRKGYSFSLTAEQQGVRPGIYWRDENNNGTWFTFSEVILEPKNWTPFVISLRGGKFLGLHSGIPAVEAAGSKPAIKLLGGYELSNPIMPHSKSDLLIGAFNSGKFRGKIGPIGIFSSETITENLDSILESFVQKPLEIPDYFSGDEIGLWSADGKTDMSDNNHNISFIRPKRGTINSLE